MRVYLEKITGKLPLEDWELLQGISDEIEIGKDEFLLKAGNICKHIWYLKKGAVRYFEYYEGVEHTTHFFIAPAMFTAYHSLLTGSSSDLHIRAEEDCILNALPYSRLRALYDRSHKLERVGRIMAEYQFIAEFNRRRTHLNMDALSRYEHLEREQPEVFQRFQLKDIATYLGITPVSLSRLRKYRTNRSN